ncbi:unnamed protein product [Nippostrongylus brasiliensis]|uniref:Glycos_transf_1 domain-containing protein n=1 Tax=Nippostrongylus brasiliensis TaxID=27835 RepID=A0A0N4XH50_NIPBR|nr:unnamed protein product [Nippostrongylus brasiliensis]
MVYGTSCPEDVGLASAVVVPSVINANTSISGVVEAMRDNCGRECEEETVEDLQNDDMPVSGTSDKMVAVCWSEVFVMRETMRVKVF